MADNSSKWLSDERVDGERYGYDAALLVVSELVNELYDQGDAVTARLIHAKVWRRISDQRDRRVGS